MSQLIIGYGNTLRAEDAFGVDVINLLQKRFLKNTTCQTCFQLTPEMALDFLDYSHIIFVDAAFSLSNEYALACSLKSSHSVNLSHHISAFHLIDIVNSLYKHYPTFEIFSMLTNNFDSICSSKAYEKALDTTVEFLEASINK